MGSLRDVTHSLTAAVEITLDQLELSETDAGAAQLARRYAEVIDGCDDQAWAIRWIAPGLLATLESLGATPLARAKLKGGKPDAAEDPLDALRRRRQGA